MKIQPIEYALFCDYASLSVDGKLNLVGVFEVGVKQDGTRLKREDYPLDEAALT